MKTQLTIIVLLITGLFSLPAMAKDNPKLKGSVEEVTKQIAADFPVGLTRDKTIAVLKEKYGVPTGKINVTDTKNKPIEMDDNGRKVAVHSWVNAMIFEYRSISSLFTKNAVSAQFNFDAERKLVFFTVSVAKGPEL